MLKLVAVALLSLSACNCATSQTLPTLFEITEFNDGSNFETPSRLAVCRVKPRPVDDKLVECISLENFIRAANGDPIRIGPENPAQAPKPEPQPDGTQRL